MTLTQVSNVVSGCSSQEMSYEKAPEGEVLTQKLNEMKKITPNNSYL